MTQESLYSGASPFISLSLLIAIYIIGRFLCTHLLPLLPYPDFISTRMSPAIIDFDRLVLGDPQENGHSYVDESLKNSLIVTSVQEVGQDLPTPLLGKIFYYISRY
jgi:hypothetical protein